MSFSDSVSCFKYVPASVFYMKAFVGKSTNQAVTLRWDTDSNHEKKMKTKPVRLNESLTLSKNTSNGESSEASRDLHFLVLMNSLTLFLVWHFLSQCNHIDACDKNYFNWLSLPENETFLLRWGKPFWNMANNQQPLGYIIKTLTRLSLV